MSSHFAEIAQLYLQALAKANEAMQKALGKTPQEAFAEEEAKEASTLSTSSLT